MASSAKRHSGIQSIEQGYYILKIISESDVPLTITEISNLCGMSKSGLHRYLTSFCRIGFLIKDHHARYSLGTEIALLGLKASDRLEVTNIAEPYLKAIHQKLNETIALGIWGQNGPFIIRKIESARSINIGIEHGLVVSLTGGATGKIFAAFYDEEMTKPLIEKELEGKSIDHAQFQKEIENIKEKGFVLSREKVISGLAAVSAPIFDQNGKLVAALTLIGVAEALDLSPESESIQLIVETANVLSRKLGYML